MRSVYRWLPLLNYMVRGGVSHLFPHFPLQSNSLSRTPGTPPSLLQLTSMLSHASGALGLGPPVIAVEGISCYLYPHFS
jgi:hypothetical protein